MSPRDGSEIMVRFQEGDDRAFEELLGLYENEMVNFFFRLTGERHSAEDMTQDLFLRVYRYRDAYEPRAAFKSFLYRMARNLWIDAYRKSRSRPKPVSIHHQRSSSEDPRSREGGGGIRIESRLPGPQEEVIRKERAARLGAALARLPEKQRVIVAFSMEGKLGYAEIGEILGIPVGTVKSRMHAAIARLRDFLGAP